MATAAWRAQCSKNRKKQWPRLRSRSRQYLPVSARSTAAWGTALARPCDIHRTAHASRGSSTDNGPGAGCKLSRELERGETERWVVPPEP
eukprot:scaffold12229_cov32-Tisochrysis_lutea.AAC.4